MDCDLSLLQLLPNFLGHETSSYLSELDESALASPDPSDPTT